MADAPGHAARDHGLVWAGGFARRPRAAEVGVHGAAARRRRLAAARRWRLARRIAPGTATASLQCQLGLRRRKVAQASTDSWLRQAQHLCMRKLAPFCSTSLSYPLRITLPTTIKASALVTLASSRNLTDKFLKRGSRRISIRRQTAASPRRRRPARRRAPRARRGRRRRPRSRHSKPSSAPPRRRRRRRRRGRCPR